VLPRHAPMLALLKEGIVTITSGGTKQSWRVGTGFAEVGPTHVTILVESSTAA
jgi:F-type H+-transporting ATPase subunit epsilon